ncbi:hypothetical protein V2J09_007904 [Rumex salicifolius]
MVTFRYVEVKKQSICNVQLINKTDQHVAFKVKTTSPKKYCVRPNVGVVLPNEACGFAVIMQAQRSPPSDMNCKDKFLVQSTIVPEGTMENDVTSDMFSKEDGKYIEERKLKVVILSPPHSPELSPMNGKVKQVPPVEDSVVADELLNLRERHSQNEVDEEDATELIIGNKEVQKTKADASWEATEAEAERIKATDPVFKRDVEFQLNIGNKEVQKTKADASWEAAVAEAELIKATEPAIKREADFQPIEVLKSNTVDKLEAKPVITKDLESQPTELVEPNTVEEDSVIVRDLESQSIEIMESDPLEKFGEKPVIVRDVESHPIQIVKSNSVDEIESKPVVRKDIQSRPTEVVDSDTVEKLETKSVKGIEPMMLKETDGLRLAKEVEEMKSKLLQLESKLSKAEKTIVKLTEDSRLSFRERQIQEKQLALLKDQRIQKTLHEEIPLLSVCMVAMLSILIGYLLHLVMNGVSRGVNKHSEATGASNPSRRFLDPIAFTFLLNVEEWQKQRLCAVKI